jgi:hypothetical protein
VLRDGKGGHKTRFKRELGYDIGWNMKEAVWTNGEEKGVYNGEGGR